MGFHPVSLHLFSEVMLVARKCCALADAFGGAQVALEQAGNPVLSDDTARQRLDTYFSLAGKDSHAALRKSGKQARESLNSYVSSLGTQLHSKSEEPIKHRIISGFFAAWVIGT